MSHQLLLLALTFLVFASVPHVKPQPTPVKFYLVLQWPKSFCNADPRCNNGIPQQFTVHGFWPPNINCQPRSTITLPQVMRWPFANDLFKYWPNLIGTHIMFWDKQWEKHGTCAFMTPQNYFKEAIQSVKYVEAKLGGSIIGALTAAKLIPGSSYDPGRFLEQIYTISNLVAEVHCNFSPTYKAQIFEIYFCFKNVTNNVFTPLNCSAPATTGTSWSSGQYTHNCGSGQASFPN